MCNKQAYFAHSALMSCVSTLTVPLWTLPAPRTALPAPRTIITAPSQHPSQNMSLPRRTAQALKGEAGVSQGLLYGAFAAVCC